MWVTTAFGLAFFGITTDALDPNQLHLLFAPIMTAYGLAFISILWSRLEFVAATPALRNVHHVVDHLICAPCRWCSPCPPKSASACKSATTAASPIGRPITPQPSTAKPPASKAGSPINKWFSPTNRGPSPGMPTA